MIGQQISRSKTVCDSSKAKQLIGTEGGFEPRVAKPIAQPFHGTSLRGRVCPCFCSCLCLSQPQHLCHCKLHLEGPNSIFWLAPGEQGHGLGPRTLGGYVGREPPCHNRHKVGVDGNLTFSSSPPGPQGRRQGTHVQERPLPFSLAMTSLPGTSTPVQAWG